LVITIVVAALICVFSVATSQAVDPQNGNKGQTAARRNLKTIIVDNYRPYTFVNEKGSPDGFSVEIVKAVATAMDLDMEIRAGTWEQATKELERGKIDLLPMMAYSRERDRMFDFSVPHTIAYDAVFHRSGDKNPGSLKDLSGKTVIVMNKDAAHDYLLSSGLSETMRLQLVDSLPEAFRQLASGKGDAAIMPKLVGIITLRRMNLSDIEPSPWLIDGYTRPFSIAVKEGDHALLERLNQGLGIIKHTGQYDAIYKKWFGALEDPHIPWKSALQIIFLAGIILIAFAAWNVSLKHQVKSRTKDLEAEVAERKRAEEELRTSQQIIEGIINAIPARVFWKDRNLNYLGCNAIFARDAGFADQKDVIGKDDFQMGWRDQAELYRGDDRQVIESGCPKLLIEEPQTTSEGTTITLLTSKIPLRNSDGEIRGVIGTYIDITNRKQAEKAVLESERLGAIGEMSSGVAHDFNNSLQVICGNLELALTDPDISKEVAECVNSAKKSATDAVARVRQLQRFTRKANNVEFSALDLNMILDEAIIQTRPIWKDETEKKGLQISFQKSYGKIRSVDGEPGEIGSVFFNLIKNAIEAMPDGGTITLETGVVDHNVYVRISDTGEGMDEGTKLRIFQPFFSTKGFELGRGLGMSAVHTTIRDHGGKISVKETAPGKGTVIEALFPFGNNKAESLEKEAVGSHQLSARVLWVDDDKEIRKIGKRYLEALGHFADMAGSGQEGLELLGKYQYDLLITDDGMPGMSGWQLLEKIKGRHPAMKIAVVTGWGADVPGEKKEKYGVGYVFGKPISMKQLQNLVIDVIRSRI